MRFVRMSVALSLWLTFSTTLFSQQSAPAADASTILQKALSALGGTASAPLISVSATGTYTRLVGARNSLPFRLMILGTDRIRRELDTPEGTYITIVSGASGWTTSPSDKKSHALPVSGLAGKMLEDAPVLLLAQFLNSPNAILQLAGTESVGGQNAVRVSALGVLPSFPGPQIQDSNLLSIYQKANRLELYFDSQSGFPLRIRYYEHPRDWRTESPLDLDFSDYRSVNGLLFPFSVTRSTSNKQLAQIQYQSITLNVAVSDRQFVRE